MSTTENKETKTSEVKDPRQFIYPQGTKIELDGYVLSDLIMIFDQLLKDEVKVESKFKYDFLNEKGKVVKSPKQEDLDSGKVVKTLNFERTVVNPNLEYSITEKGIAYAELKKFLESIHFRNIQEGKAINYTELAKNQADNN